MAAMEALNSFESKVKPVRTRILDAFKAARTKDKNYGRPTKYAVYKVTQSGERFDGEVSATSRSEK